MREVGEVIFKNAIVLPDPQPKIKALLGVSAYNRAPIRLGLISRGGAPSTETHFPDPPHPPQGGGGPQPCPPSLVFLSFVVILSLVILSLVTKLSASSLQASVRQYFPRVCSVSLSLFLSFSLSLSLPLSSFICHLPLCFLVCICFSLSLSLPFLWGVGKSDCKTVHFYFPALEPWPGPENKNVTF